MANSNSIWLTTRMATVQIGRVYPISWTGVSNELDKRIQLGGYCTNRHYLAILFLGAFFAPIRADFSLKSPTLTSRKRLFCLFYVPFAPFQHNRAHLRLPATYFAYR